MFFHFPYWILEWDKVSYSLINSVIVFRLWCWHRLSISETPPATVINVDIVEQNQSFLDQIKTYLVCTHTHVRTPSLSSSPSTLIFPALLSSYLSFPSWPVSYLTLHSLPLSYPPTSLTSSSISLSLFFLIPHSTSPSSYLSPAFLYFPSLSFGATSKNIAFWRGLCG